MVGTKHYDRFGRLASIRTSAPRPERVNRVNPREPFWRRTSNVDIPAAGPSRKFPAEKHAFVLSDKKALEILQANNDLLRYVGDMPHHEQPNPYGVIMRIRKLARAVRHQPAKKQMMEAATRLANKVNRGRSKKFDSIISPFFRSSITL